MRCKPTVWRLPWTCREREPTKISLTAPSRCQRRLYLRHTRAAPSPSRVPSWPPGVEARSARPTTGESDRPLPSAHSSAPTGPQTAPPAAVLRPDTWRALPATCLSPPHVRAETTARSGAPHHGQHSLPHSEAQAATALPGCPTAAKPRAAAALVT